MAAGNIRAIFDIELGIKNLSTLPSPSIYRFAYLIVFDTTLFLPGPYLAQKLDLFHSAGNDIFRELIDFT